MDSLAMGHYFLPVLQDMVTSLPKVRCAVLCTPDGFNIAFFPHMYDSTIESATYTPGGEVKYDPKFFDTYGGVIDVYPDAHKVPVMFGEWGIAHPEAKGMDQFVADAIGLMEDHGSGLTMFNGCRGGGYCPFDADGNDLEIDRDIAEYQAQREAAANGKAD